MDIHYVMKRAVHDEQLVRKAISDLLDIFFLINSSSGDAINALSSEINDYEDALMVETAIAGKMDCIITRNSKDYHKSTVKTYTPEVFLEVYQM